MFETIFGWHNLQRLRSDDLDDWILKQHREMYEVFFEERRLIPSRSYYEIAFEDLEKNPVGEMRALYQALELPEFRSTEAALEQYTNSIRGYRKNEFPTLEPRIREGIYSMWKSSFQEWEYAK